MKKLSLLVGGIILSSAVMAQKPSSDVPMTLEGQLGLNAGTAGGTNLNFLAPSLRFRYFFADNMAARVTVGINNNSRTLNAFQFGDGTGSTGTAEFKNNSMNFGIGAEYHFAGTDRLSPYGGLDIGFGSGKATADYTNSVDIATPPFIAYAADRTESREAKTSSFGIGLVAGTDYYFAENFYLGLELGLGFNSVTTKEATTTVTTGGTTTTGVAPEHKDGFFGNTFIGNLRLGWRF